MAMVRVDLYITEKQANFLDNLEGGNSEHVRRALDEYIEKLTGQNTASSSSKGGDNGKSY